MNLFDVFLLSITMTIKYTSSQQIQKISSNYGPDYNFNHHGAQISVIRLIKRSAIKLLILIL